MHLKGAIGCAQNAYSTKGTVEISCFAACLYIYMCTEKREPGFRDFWARIRFIRCCRRIIYVLVGNFLIFQTARTHSCVSFPFRHS